MPRFCPAIVLLVGVRLLCGLINYFLCGFLQMFGVCNSIWVEVMVFFSFISSFSFNVVTCCLIGLPMWGCPYWFVVELGLVNWYEEVLITSILPSSPGVWVLEEVCCVLRRNQFSLFVVLEVKF